MGTANVTMHTYSAYPLGQTLKAVLDKRDDK
jgi:hypothetical protein